MRLLVVTHNYPRFPGDPAGWYVWRLAEAARDAGHEVLVLAPHTAGTAEVERSIRLGVRRFRYGPALLERIGYRGERPRRIVTDPLAVIALPLYAARFVSAARRAVKDFRPDLIHAHWWFPAGWVVSRLGRPYLVSCHGTDVRLLESGLFRRLARPVLSRARAVTAVSRFLAQDIRQRAGSLPREIIVSPMPLDVDAFARGRETPKASPPRILYAGNLVRAKGVDLAVQAVGQLVARGVACRLKILGEGPDRPRLQELTRELGVTQHVDWSDFVPRDAMPAEYGASTVTVLPSRGAAEGLGLALAEALSAGSAVVATPAGGIPEIVIHEQTGLLARDGDADDLAAQLERLLRDASMRQRLTDAGAAQVRSRFAPAEAARHFLELYHSIAHDQPAH